jgi:hypothetical protein
MAKTSLNRKAELFEKAKKQTITAAERKELMRLVVAK